MDKETLVQVNKLYDIICQYRNARNKINDFDTYFLTGPHAMTVIEHLLTCIDSKLNELEKQFEQL